MSNPYETPESEIIDSSSNSGLELGTRGERFGAAFIDGLIGIALAIPFWMMIGMWELMLSGQPFPLEYSVYGAVYGLVAYLVVHYYFLKRNGQSIGKYLMKIKIVDLQDKVMDVNSIILKRYLPISIASAIPFVGFFLFLIDVLFIFRRDKRCVHDLIAGSKVVKA